MTVAYSIAMQKDFDGWNVTKKYIDATLPLADCHEREVWWCAVGVNVGYEQHSQTYDFARPIVVGRRFTRDIFLGIPLTTKIKDYVPFRVRCTVDDVANDALILQMRVFDRRRLLRKIGVLPKETFTILLDAVVDAVVTTNPAFAGFSEAEANVYQHHTLDDLGVNSSL